MKCYDQWAFEARQSGEPCTRIKSKDMKCVPLRDDSKCRGCFNSYCASVVKKQKEAR